MAVTAAEIPLTGDMAKLAKRFGISQQRIIELRREKLQGQVTSDEGLAGDLETQSFNDRSARRFTGNPVKFSRQYFDKDFGVTVHAPLGQFFEISSDGSVRTKEGVPPRTDDPKLTPIRTDPDAKAEAEAMKESAGASKLFEQTAAFQSDAFKSLSSADQDFIRLSYGAFSSNSEEQAQRLMGAIDQAVQLADPFFKAQLNLAKADMIAEITRNTQDFAFGERAIKRVRDELLESVAASSTALSLEEQAEISKTLKQFDRDILDISDAAAEKGVTFGVGRGTREEGFRTRTEDVREAIGSTRRAANLQQKQLALRASAGESLAQEQLDKARFSKGFNLQNIGREAEKILGTTEATQIPGLTGSRFVGGVEGEVEGQRKATIRENITKFFELGSPVV